jgi:hypothetical protein
MALERFMLVHGAWHGGWCWVKVADAGHEAFTPTLTDAMVMVTAPGEIARI